MQGKAGIIITCIVVGLVAAILIVNMRSDDAGGKALAPGDGGGNSKLASAPSPSTGAAQPASQPGAGANPLAGVERFVGEVEKNHMLIASVYLPPIQMEGMELPQDKDVIHLEADIHATEGNPNGFAAGEWVPYLTVHYEIIPEKLGVEPVTGEFDPMVAKDGPHYGATIRMPGPGKYKLIYELEPPGKKGFGRHTDPITGVAPFWDKFRVEFAFNYEPTSFGEKAGAASPTK